MRISDWSSDVCSSDLCSGSPECINPIGTLYRPACILRDPDTIGFGPIHRQEYGGAHGDELGIGRDAHLACHRQTHGAYGSRPGNFAKEYEAFVFIHDRLPFLGMAMQIIHDPLHAGLARFRSAEHTSELQSLMRISYAVFCLKNKTKSN